MTKKQAQFENALEVHAAQELAARDMQLPGVIDTVEEITFDWQYYADMRGTLTRSTVAITNEIRDTARGFRKQWEDSAEHSASLMEESLTPHADEPAKRLAL